MTISSDQLLAELDRLRQELARQHEQEGGLSNFLAGLALGVLAGGALALAFAPASGEDTRAQVVDATTQLRDRASQVADQVRDQAGTLQGQAQETVSQVKERAQGFVESTREQVDSLKNQARDSTERVSSAVTDASQRAADAVKGVSQAATSGATGAASGSSGGGGSQAGVPRTALTGEATEGGTKQPELGRHYGGDSAADKAKD